MVGFIIKQLLLYTHIYLWSRKEDSLFSKDSGGEPRRNSSAFVRQRTI